MREKLIELIGQVQDCGCDVTDVVEMNYVENITLADHLIANGVTLQKWIPVSERLPDCADTVLAVDRDGIRSTAYYVGYWHGGGDLDENAVTHWMPLPDPPKGE